MAIKLTDVKQVGAERLRQAVRSVIESQGPSAAATRPSAPPPSHRLPGAAQLRAGAEAARGDSDDPKARYFQSILELGYLVASADGFADEERSALAALLEHATGAAVNKDELEVHFRDLEEGVNMLGRRERLRRAAADFEDSIGRAEAISFTALIAVADGVLAGPELEALTELGACFEMNPMQVVDIVEGVARAVERAIATEVSG